jgi:Flp pilus assembly protein TadG
MIRRHDERRLVAAVELAMLLPLLSLLFVGVLDFCRIFYYAQTLQNAARCGALYASGTVAPAPGTTPQNAAVQAALAEAVSLDPPLQAQNVTVTTSGTNVTVSVAYQWQAVTPYPALPSAVSLNFSATFPNSPVSP